MTFAERMFEAGTGTVIGVLTVFLVLLILWGFIEIMHVVVVKATAPKKSKTAVAETEQKNGVDNQSAADSTELIAVLTAAVACMMESQGAPVTSFKIKSFRRTN